jgi:RNA polymerase sigma factor (sigma-70 family)
MVGEAVEAAEFEVFCAAISPRVLRALAAQVGDPGVAEELAQETLIRVALHWKKVVTMDRPDLWTMRVATNLGRSWWRRRYVERRVNEQAARTATWVHQDDRLAAELREGLAQLPTRQRQAVTLRYLLGYPVEDVAEILGCAPGTVKSLTHRGIDALRRAWTGDEAVDQAVDEQTGRPR